MLRTPPGLLSTRPSPPLVRVEPRAGVGEATEWSEVQLQQAQQTARALSQVASNLENLRKQGEDDKNVGEGSLGSLRGPTRWLVYLGRCCDTLTVDVCEGLVGRELFDSARKVGDAARSLLTQIGFPSPSTTA